ncbi:TPA: PTS glucose transporter subunit IIA [Clostridioides difficile]|uniref:Glucose-specific phosphotransferase enzyme IIA component n=6 Tax=Clostridioides difficile TaxID=1496 RepID=A0A9X8RHU1_CLODI|nr:PTS glucose transporter subunit IIA [Clostridioides difficile]EQG61014.1 PTS system, glucose subfamily, IIA component domain protein [Clostridioides difficile DA00149]EQI42156.1 PTS system, glucose subfamily, IIA component domain protein [Clostridioides difficile Y184]EQK79403.1 PTS system, glucose subfamily, IIA component domain protein [Clostridioides difficile CD127]AMM57062.1 hypothetical protein TW87_11375 [Clostridioides difficile]AUA21725.1 PTS sugar transporter subunit IIA [Clostrid
MLSIFKSKKNDNKLKAFASGKVIPIEDVDDNVFSSKMLGDGIAIYPTNEYVVAPCDAEVNIIMKDTKHAVGIKLFNGMEILFHVGIDTVSMNGEGFEIFVSPGDKIKRGDKLISFNSKLIKEEGLQDVVIMVVTNSEQYKNIKYHIGLEAVIDDTIIAEI